MFDGSNRPPQPTIAEIQQAICARKGLTLEELKGQCRKRRLSWPRQVAMHLCRELTDGSYPKIARHFGNRDHTTVLWAFRKVRLVAAERPDMEIALNQLRERIAEMVAARPAPAVVDLPAPPPPPKPVAAVPRRRRAHTEMSPWRPERPRLSLPRSKAILEDIEAWRSLGQEEGRG